uniref:Oxysterol-binding protein n=1 Tax=Picocystis salinarum TaxID=88271 RepID=A0A7S3UEB1_9CHLO
MVARDEEGELKKSLRPGKELRHDVALPSKFLVPRSALQVLEDVFYAGNETHTIGRPAQLPTPESRMVGVLQWFLHSVSTPAYLKKPYNPILGETHMFKAKDAYVVAEQVSHHPPVTAYYAEDERGRVRYNGQFEPRATFTGVGVMVRMVGRNCIHLMEEEMYELPLLNLHFRLLPPIGAEWVGKTRILCRDTKLCIQLEFKPRTMNPTGSWNVVKGTFFRYSKDPSSPTAIGNTVLMSFKGSWKGKVLVTYSTCEVGYDVGDVLVDCLYKTKFDPVFRSDFVEALNPEDVKSSRHVWTGLTKALFAGDAELAAQEKHKVEARERALRKQRKSSGTSWSPRFFSQESGVAWSGETIDIWTIKTHKLMEHTVAVAGGKWQVHCPCCMPPRMRMLPQLCTLKSHPLSEEDFYTPRRTLSSPLGRILGSKHHDESEGTEATCKPYVVENKKQRKSHTHHGVSAKQSTGKFGSFRKIFRKRRSLPSFEASLPGTNAKERRSLLGISDEAVYSNQTEDAKATSYFRKLWSRESMQQPVASLEKYAFPEIPPAGS